MGNTTENQKLAVAPIRPLLFSLAIPAITAQVINALYNMVDRIYIGHIPDAGGLALTGVGVTFPLIMIISAFEALISMGGAPKASIAMGQKDYKTAEKILGSSTTMLIGISIALSVFCMIFRRPLLYAFGASDNTYPYAASYFTIYLFGTIFVQLSMGLNAFITTQGFAKVSMQTIMLGAGINIVLDPILIFGFGMGVQGAALATILSQAVSAIWVLCFLNGSKTQLKIRKKYLKPDFKLILPCMALGVAPFIMRSTESLILLCFNFSLLRFGGDLAVGTMTVLSAMMQFAMMPLSGFTQGAQPIISYNFGAKNKERVRETFKLLLTCCLTYSCLLWAVVMLFPGAIGSIFTSDPDIIEMVRWALRVYMASTLIFGAQIACQQTFVALGNAKTSSFLAILRKIILLIPLIFILPLFVQSPEQKVFAVFLAEPITDFLAVVTTVTMFRKQFKKTLTEL